MKNDLKSLNLKCIKLQPIELVLNFIYVQLDFKGDFKKELLLVAKKYRRYWIKYKSHLILTDTTFLTIKNEWK